MDIEGLEGFLAAIDDNGNFNIEPARNENNQITDDVENNQESSKSPGVLEYIAAETFMQKVNIDQYSENKKMQIATLIELKNQDETKAYKIMNRLVNLGIYLIPSNDKLKIIPIIWQGEHCAGCMTSESWQKIRSVMSKNKRFISVLNKVFRNLIQGKIHYDSCVIQSVSTSPQRPQCKFKADCIFCNCGYATAVFEKKMQKEYNRFKPAEPAQSVETPC